MAKPLAAPPRVPFPRGRDLAPQPHLAPFSVTRDSQYKHAEVAVSCNSRSPAHGSQDRNQDCLDSGLDGERQSRKHGRAERHTDVAIPGRAATAPAAAQHKNGLFLPKIAHFVVARGEETVTRAQGCGESRIRPGRSGAWPLAALLTGRSLG